MEAKFIEIKMTSGIPNSFTMTNDTNWLNINPSGMDRINANIPNNIFSLTSKRAITFFFISKAYMFQVLCFFSQT